MLLCHTHVVSQHLQGALVQISPNDPKPMLAQLSPGDPITLAAASALLIIGAALRLLDSGTPRNGR